MMANDWQRLNIWLKMVNKFDYDEFEAACSADGCESLPVLEFAQKVGMVSCSLQMYPELPVAEGYLKLLRERQAAFHPPAATQAQVPPQQQQAQPGQLPPGYKKEMVTITFADGRTEEQELVMPDGTQRQGCCGGGQVR